jgi:hypothetical protein
LTLLLLVEHFIVPGPGFLGLIDFEFRLIFHSSLVGFATDATGSFATAKSKSKVCTILERITVMVTFKDG